MNRGVASIENHGTMRPLNSENAVIAIELAIAIPIFFVFFFGLLWFGTFLNMMVSFPVAIDNALRAAITRGQLETYIGAAYLPNIGNWDNSSAAARGAALSSAFTNRTNYAAALSEFKSWHGHWPSNRPPSHYIMALLFINESIRESMGGAVLFPCDPAVDVDSVALKSGCMKCVFLNPETMDTTEFGGDSQLQFLRIAIECSIRPGNQLMRPFLALISATSRQSTAGFLLPVLTHRAVFNLPWEGIDWYQ